MLEKFWNILLNLHICNKKLEKYPSSYIYGVKKLKNIVQVTYTNQNNLKISVKLHICNKKTKKISFKLHLCSNFFEKYHSSNIWYWFCKTPRFCGKYFLEKHPIIQKTLKNASNLCKKLINSPFWQKFLRFLGGIPWKCCKFQIFGDKYNIVVTFGLTFNEIIFL